MGLFSFNKDSGKKSDGVSDEAKGKFLEEIIKKHGLDIDGLKVEVAGHKVSVWGIVNKQSTKEKIILALGNVAGISEVEDFITVGKTKEKQEEEKTEKENQSKFYTVKKGDSLSKISKEVYGDAMKYKEIFEANKPMLKDMNLIYPGQVLRIPELN